MISDAESQRQALPSFRITVNDRLQPSEQFVTLAHELGHIFCGHLGACTSRTGKDEESGWPDRRSVGRRAAARIEIHYGSMAFRE